MSTPTEQPGKPASERSGARTVVEKLRRGREDLKAANDRLRETEARYRELIRALPAAIYTCDAEGRISLYNQAAAALWGREPAAGRTFWCGSRRLFRPDGSELPHEESPMAQAIRERRPAQGEIVIEHADGTRVNAQASAAPVFDRDGVLAGAIGLLVDRTEQARAEEAQARLAAIVDSSDDAVVSKNLDGIVRTWNGGAERIFGYRAEEMIGQPITRIIPPELHDEEWRILEKIRRGERVEHFETVRIAKDGRHIDVSLRISPIHNAAGRIIGASKIARDVTENKRIARALAEADRRKDQFLAMLAHELRNPLAAVASGIELLGMPGGPEHVDSTRRMIDRQTKHLVHLVDDLMDMSRLSRGIVTLRRETLDARSVVERAIETVRPRLDAQRHGLRIDLGEEPLPVHAD
ncbi:MAG TPA: PAS domain S-box protein, partial [Woeseiaceae bacterium]|nr:PAS domain S-box protein [Woeseiaceae bacterium]